MKIWRKVMLFCLGGGGYVCLELLWRGRSHGSMFFLGGLCFTLIGRIEERCGRLAPAVRMLLGAVSITALELLTGLLVNRDHRVWDYRSMPFHFRGQICLNYALLWVPASLLAMTLYHGATRTMKQ